MSFQFEITRGDQNYYAEITNYTYHPPKGGCVQKCVTPCELDGYEDWDYVVYDEHGTATDIELTPLENGQMLQAYYTYTAD